MCQPDRRRLLHATALGLGGALAGCVGGRGGSDGGDDRDGDVPTDDNGTGDDGSGDNDGGDDGSGDNDGGDDGRGDHDGEDGSGDGGTDPGTVVAFETMSYATRSAVPDWYEDDADTPGTVRIAASAERARAMLDLGDVPEARREAVSDFLDETDFETSLLVLVETVGPTTCYRRVDFSGIGLSDGRLVASAAARDMAQEDQVCGQALTFPATLLRVTVDGAPPTEATVTVTDGWGQSRAITATVEDPLD